MGLCVPTAIRKPPFDMNAGRWCHVLTALFLSDLPLGSATCNCHDVCPCHNVNPECNLLWYGEAPDFATGAKCGGSFSTLRGWCTCNVFGCNCDACGNCAVQSLMQSPLAKLAGHGLLANRTEEELKDYKEFFHTWNDTQHRDHLGDKYCSGRYRVSVAFKQHLLDMADLDGDGAVSPEEFVDARSPVDFHHWPLSTRCEA